MEDMLWLAWASGQWWLDAASCIHLCDESLVLCIWQAQLCRLLTLLLWANISSDHWTPRCAFTAHARQISLQLGRSNLFGKSQWTGQQKNPSTKTRKLLVEPNGPTRLELSADSTRRQSTRANIWGSWETWSARQFPSFQSSRSAAYQSKERQIWCPNIFQAFMELMKNSWLSPHSHKQTYLINNV